MTTTLHRHPELDATDAVVETEVVTSPVARKALAVLRIAFGLTLLFAFFDKLLALGFTTGRDQETGLVDRFGDAAWIHGASPTEGFLAHGVNADSPFAGLFTGLAGSVVIDWLFMLGLLGIGIGLTFGVGIRLAGITGAMLYLAMYAAVMVPENNPVFDDHLIGAISVLVLALTLAGDTWGAGKAWGRTRLVRRYGLLR